MSEKVKFMRLIKATLVQQLSERILEAQEKRDTALEARINAVLAIVNTLPDCQ
jgi:hypothetical protein